MLAMCAATYCSFKLHTGAAGEFGLSKQLGMSTGTHENYLAWFAVINELVGQQEIAADVTFAVADPVATGQRMVLPFRPERAIVGNQQQHGFLEPVHVEPAGLGQTRPIFAK